MNRTIENKKAFVGKLSALVHEIDPDIKSVEYRCFPEKYSEIVRIYYGFGSRIINVTGDSLRTILVEIARELNGQNAVGAIVDPRHAELIVKWWAEYDEKDPETEPAAERAAG